VLMAGGQLYKVQLPQIADTPSRLPEDLDVIARDMARSYRPAAAGPVGGREALDAGQSG